MTKYTHKEGKTKKEQKPPMKRTKSHIQENKNTYNERKHTHKDNYDERE